MNEISEKQNTKRVFEMFEETDNRVKHMNQLHRMNKVDDIKWRNSKEGKKFIKEHEKF